MAWSPEQEQAITARGQNILVAAAAGSGKTSVLVERILRRISDPADPADVDRLLVVTFTNAAAAEMRQRVAGALADLAQKQPTRHLQRQLTLLPSASITTLHSFCQSIVRQYFYLVDLDPGFKIGNPTELELLGQDTAESLLVRLYEAQDPDFMLLVEHYGDMDGDEALASYIRRLYDFSRSHPWPQYWLQQAVERFDLAEEATLDETVWSGLIRDGIALKLEKILYRLEALIGEALRTDGFEPYADAFRQDKALVEQLLQAARQSWTALEAVMLTLQFAKIPTLAKTADPEWKEYFKDKQRDGRIKKTVNDLKEKYFSRSQDLLLADMRSVRPVVAALANVALAYGREYSQAKQDKNLVDFNDLEHYCLEILLASDAAPGCAKPSTVAEELAAKYLEVMVDEYQDTNGVQETILSLIASRCPNRFMVGDVKQSIYRFRLAEPGLFLAKYRSYGTGPEGDTRRIDLSQNFRSRPEILSAVNFLFAQLMTEQAAEMDYGEAERLNPGPDYPDCPGTSLTGVELHIFERPRTGPATEAQAEERDDPDPEADQEDSNTPTAGEAAEPLAGFEQEAAYISQRLLTLIESGSMIFDKGQKQYRQLEWRDIVILLRAVEGKAAYLLDTLRQAGIPAYAELKAGYFQEGEVQVIMSLLQILDNPRQDIQLAAVLRSPLFGFASEDLAVIRLEGQGPMAGRNPPADLWDDLETVSDNSVNQLLAAKVAAAIAKIRDWRELARTRSVPELIWQIYRETGYYDYVGGMPGGVFRQANLRALYDRARQYETTNYRGLFRFLRFIDRMRQKGSDLSTARALGENENVVRIMSIHKSKGLEFPVVFLADLGKGMNLSDTRQPILCHQDLGIGPYVTLPQERFRYPTLARYGMIETMIRQAKAEELRVLYVAMTRAREKLIMTGSVAKLAEKCSVWSQTLDRPLLALPDSIIAGAAHYLDWLGPAVSRHPEGLPLRKLAGLADSASSLIKDPSCWQVTIHPAAVKGDDVQPAVDLPVFWEQVRCLEPIPAGSEESWVRDRLSWQYQQQAAAGKPAKLTVTEIKRRFAQPDDGQQRYSAKTYAKPRFVQLSGRFSQAELGTILHTAVQHLDLNQVATLPAVRRQLEQMVEQEILLLEEEETISPQSIVDFLASPIGQRLRRAKWVRRELPFSVMTPAGRFYSELAGSSDEIFIQGVVDCLFAEEDDTMVLVDYKTDAIENAQALTEKYSAQITIYAEALEQILKQPVKEKYLYSFHLQQAIRV
ncbi:helicase-exonuclease AddAB subunit AddA [Acetonema longum]|uniref:ATP-dependent helicase/nuclease subunit A n=1 Tax=Acetonema longum DSM 6540 TaxID=1009370 RepID=F7NIZ4_9FIRM|nr:helicase-exonuclease AddAB subunit AddA [Acetonema longum]EGO63991.1 recombination helicase AddA [Acetonema longum DSM 6540]